MLGYLKFSIKRHPHTLAIFQGRTATRFIKWSLLRYPHQKANKRLLHSMSSSTESDDEQMKQAIALSLQEQQHEDITLPVTAEPPVASMLGLDRKAMEQERLARSKRKISISPSSQIRPSKVVKSATPPEKKEKVNIDQERSISSKAGSTQGPSLKSQSRLPHATGAVKKTWSFGFERQGDDIKIEEVLQKSDLQLAVLSSFQWDVDWLMRKINNTTKLVFVMQAKDEATKEQYTRETADQPNLRLCFPSMSGNVNCMHSKLMLLSFPTYLRVAIPTANLVPYDWGESGVIENSVFLIDLPRLLPGTPPIEDEGLTPFGQELKYFCNAMGLQQEIVQSLSKFDFSATKDIAFVHTIGGEHSGASEPWRRTGYCGLGRAVSRLGLNTTKDIKLDFIASSLGAINIDFLSTLYLAAQGDDGITEYEWRNKPKSRKKLAGSQPAASTLQESTQKAVENNFKLYFPSRNTVLASRGGKNAAGPICFQQRWYESPKFPRKVLQDCRSTRNGLLMHNKIIYVRPPGSSPTLSSTSTSSSELGARPWAYVGSANCSESAWGRLVLDRAKKMPKLNCRNWECGVIIPVLDQTSYHIRPDSLDVFTGTVPVPIQHPAQEMGTNSPWYYSGDD